MSKLSRVPGSTSQIFQIVIQNSSVTTGAGLTGLTSASAGLTAYYHRDTDTTATAISLTSMTSGTFTSGGFVEVDATHMPGVYQFCPPNAAFSATGSPTSLVICLQGATNMAPVWLEIDLDTQADVRQWLGTAVTAATAGIPDVNVKNINNTAAATPGASGGLLISGSNAGTTTLAALTVSGTFTISDGLVVNRSTGNSNAVTFTASGTGTGLKIATGIGATGDAVQFVTNTNNGNGLTVTGHGTGHGAVFTSGAGGTGDGVRMISNSAAGSGLTLSGVSFDLNAQTTNALKVNVTAINGATAATPGASGGLLIAGSNAATTFASMTVTGTTTMNDGLVISRTTANSSGMVVTGNGTGNGAIFTSGSGATGDGLVAQSAATAGNGITALANGLAVDFNAATTNNLQVNVTQWNSNGGVSSLSPDAIFVNIGLAQAGTSNTITLDAGASSTNNLYQNEGIFITAGTGAGQSNIISSYVGATKVATVINAWVVNPDSTSNYAVMSIGPTAAGSAPTAAQIATAVWQDSTSGDFTVASSIGKSLYTGGVVPGGSSGLMISGTNSGTTTLGALTVTGTFNIQDGLVVSRTTGNSSAISATGSGLGSGIIVTGGNAVTTTPGGPGFSARGGAASGSTGGSAGVGFLVVGGSGAATNNGAATGMAISAGGTTTVSGSDGVKFVGSGNGSGMVLVGAGTGFDLNATTTDNLAVNTTEWGGTSVGATPPDQIFIRANTAQGGGASTITLDAGASSTNNLYQNEVIFITAGTGAGQSAVIVSYVGATKVATVATAWATAPDNTSAFVILAVGPSTATSSGPTAAQIATAIWTDATGSDFTAAGSIGKGLFTGGAVPGASGGLFIAGSNAATSVNFTGNLSGSVGSVTGNIGGNVNGSVGSLASQAQTDVAGAAWNAVLANYLTPGSTGFALNAAGSAGDPWATAIPGAYAAGTAGFLVGNKFGLAINVSGAVAVDGTSPLIEAYPAPGAALTLGSALYSINQQQGAVSIPAGSVKRTVFQRNGITPAMSFTLDSPTAPTASVQTA